MTSWISVPHRIISDIAVSIQALWIGIARHNRIGTDEVVNIRRIGPFHERKKVVKVQARLLRCIDKTNWTFLNNKKGVKVQSL